MTQVRDVNSVLPIGHEHAFFDASVAGGIGPDRQAPLQAEVHERSDDGTLDWRGSGKSGSRITCWPSTCTLA